MNENQNRFSPPLERLTDPRHAALRYIGDIGSFRPGSGRNVAVRPGLRLTTLADDLETGIDNGDPVLFIDLSKSLAEIAGELGRLRGCVQWINDYCGGRIDVLGWEAQAAEKARADISRMYRGGHN